MKESCNQIYWHWQSTDRGWICWLTSFVETKGITKSISCNERSSRPAAEKLGKGGGGSGRGRLAARGSGGGVGRAEDIGESRRGGVREDSDATFDVTEVEPLTEIWQATGVGSGSLGWGDDGQAAAMWRSRQ